MSKKLLIMAIGLAVICLIVSCCILGTMGLSEKKSGSLKGKAIVIDPGHGDIDPGKVGCKGTLEKDLNLQIAKKVKTELRKKSAQVILTREKDEGLYQASDRRKKVADLQARVKLINNSQADLVISIHQNSFTDASVRGAQVFFFTHSEQGEKAAEIMQTALREADRGNTRQAKANETYYLLKNTKPPTIIVECGFLSNPSEEKQLLQPEYQKEIAEAVCKGAEDYLTKY